MTALRKIFDLASYYIDFIIYIYCHMYIYTIIPAMTVN